MALIGNLKDMNISNIIQLNCMEKNIAMLSVKQRGKSGALYFEGGQIVHAVFGNIEGKDAVYKILELTDGEFKVENGVATIHRTVKTGWNSLLLEGMRIIDEAREKRDEASEKVFEQIRNLQGVKDVVIHGKDDDGADNDLGDGTLNHVIDKADAIGALLNFGTFQRSYVGAKDERVLIIRHDPYYLQVKMGSDSLVDSVDSSINNILVNV